jgi:hypothetical protein
MLLSVIADAPGSFARSATPCEHYFAMTDTCRETRRGRFFTAPR